ncbi:dienelactone hydrolase family protein [Microtetraspora sp. NBRC 16547]|uniref:dienelactone hydrolase family protein n=1 Tax=Microtetraspora sp. NBRC 16547 TaxID=3030993 RepID=UPI0024A3891A|nr:dienelactone hydrolase family protein [Microtetraspora sp. NBRC 16547]GLX00730.1 hypothetical protein Misp02_48160 [Microtetraspora sp. NBRC 16547]
MCYDAGAVPPIHGALVTTAISARLPLTSADGAEFAAYLSCPGRASGVGVLVLPDNRGLSGFYEQFTVRLAEQGHHALAIDYFGRTAGTGSPTPARTPGRARSRFSTEIARPHRAGRKSRAGRKRVAARGDLTSPRATTMQEYGLSRSSEIPFGSPLPRILIRS